MRRVAWLLLAALVVETLSPAGACAEPITPGTRIRLTGDWTNGPRRIGSFVQATEDSIWIREDLRETPEGRRWSIARAKPTEEGAVVGFPDAEVRRLEISTGPEYRTGRNAVTGLLVGVAAGALLGGLVGDDSGLLDRSQVAGLTAVGGGLLGLGFGLLVSTKPDEGWREVSRPGFAARER